MREEVKAVLRERLARLLHHTLDLSFTTGERFIGGVRVKTDAYSLADRIIQIVEEVETEFEAKEGETETVEA